MEKKISSNRFESDANSVKKNKKPRNSNRNFEFKKSATQKWSEQKESAQITKKPRSPTQTRYVHHGSDRVKPSGKSAVTGASSSKGRYVKESDKKKKEGKKNRKESVKQARSSNTESRFVNEIQQTANRFTNTILDSIPGARFVSKDNKAVKKAEQDRQTKKFRQQKSKEEEIVQTFMDVRRAIIRQARKLLFQGHIKMAVAGFIIAFTVTNVVLTACLGSCGYALSDGVMTIMYGVSPAGDADMTDCDSYFGELEMNLSLRIDNIEAEYPDCDEYVIDRDPIGHDSFILMAFLSAVYQSYSLNDVQDVLDEIFESMYTLTITESSEDYKVFVLNESTGLYEPDIKTRTTLTVTLETADLSEILDDLIPDDEIRETYEIYLDTGGGHQTFYNPFTENWTDHITSRFGWRLHPIYEDARFHYGVDIGMAEGTEIHACSTGFVKETGNDSAMGNYIVIEDKTGYLTYYEHLSEIDVESGDEITHGDVIGKVGSTGDSTGPHLHLGIKDADGNWLNPEFMVSAYNGGI